MVLGTLFLIAAILWIAAWFSRHVLKKDVEFMPATSRRTDFIRRKRPQK